MFMILIFSMSVSFAGLFDDPFGGGLGDPSGGDIGGDLGDPLGGGLGDPIGGGDWDLGGDLFAPPEDYGIDNLGEIVYYYPYADELNEEPNAFTVNAEYSLSGDMETEDEIIWVEIYGITFFGDEVLVGADSNEVFFDSIWTNDGDELGEGYVGGFETQVNVAYNTYGSYITKVYESDDYLGTHKRLLSTFPTFEEYYGGGEPPVEDIEGCMDYLAFNYNPEATLEDDSCLYAPLFLNDLSVSLDSTFGVLNYNFEGITHGDIVTATTQVLKFEDEVWVEVDTVYTTQASDVVEEQKVFAIQEEGVYKVITTLKSDDLVITQESVEFAYEKNVVIDISLNSNRQLSFEDIPVLLTTKPHKGATISSGIVNWFSEAFGDEQSIPAFSIVGEKKEIKSFQKTLKKEKVIEVSKAKKVKKLSFGAKSKYWYVNLFE